VLGLRERSKKSYVDGKPDKPGRVKFVHISDGKKDSIRAAVEANVNPAVQRIFTDSASVYDFALDKTLQKKHRSVNHSIQWIIPGTRIHTNTVESSFSLLKRGLIGSFHRVSIKHLHRYLSEFEFRFNERKAEDRFSATLRRMLGIAPMPYVELIATPKA